MNYNSITFDHPFLLLTFLIFVPMIFFDIYNRKNRDKLPEELGNKIIFSVFLFRLFIAFLIIALAGPRWGIGFSAAEYRLGLDTVFAIDVSRSMDIQENAGYEQSRLERGLFISKETVMAVPGARFAAAIGRHKGFLAVPLTWDNEAVLTFFNALDGSSMTGRSTNLEALIDAAADAFLNTSAASKVIVLVSDGETHSGVITNALNRCIKEGISVITVALGSDIGRLVPETEFISRRDAAVMRMIADRTGGIYIDGSRNDAAAILSGHLYSIAQITGYGSARKETKERRTLFIILAILTYGLFKLIPLLPVKTFKRGMSLVSIISVFLFTSCSESKLLLLEANYLSSRGRYDEAIVPYLKALDYNDAAPYAEYGLGLIFYSLDESNVALKRYNNSKRMLDNISGGEHRELRYRNFYNSGIIFFEEGDYYMAASAFRDALRVDSRKIDAKRNLELSLMSIAKEAEKDNRNEVQQENETREILFEYLREREHQLWKSREWTPEEDFTGPDY
jgi:Ca-activated chloride channel family protein